jgi:acetylornithine deacetylase
MAAALHAMAPDVLAQLAHKGVQIIFIGAMGEETGNLGALALEELALQVDQAVVLEPTELDLVHAHKGACWMEIELSGVAAHGAHPEQGFNAVASAGPVIHALQEMIQADRDAVSSPLLGGPTLNIGAIQGGNAYNVVPDTCLLRLDRRSLPRENHADIVRAVKARLAALQENGLIHGYNVMVKTDCAAFCTDSDATLIKGLAAACRAHGAEPAINGASWFSDAGPLAKWCREVVVFGPGDIRQAHTIGEYINLEALQKGSDILRTFLQMSAD